MKRSSGPYTVVDADTLTPMRKNRFSSLDKAFAFGYSSYGWCEGQDFKVLDEALNPVPRSRSNLVRIPVGLVVCK